ncbi:MAG TPA: TlyA family RNA methyltransferase [Solirubrobacteraceae bacterium]|nr:TlyA family RNA methyltransferase [Solirubrobacteraceae bacterium]
MPKQRLDTLLAERGLFASRSRAAASVMAGEVCVGAGGRRAQKPGELVDPDALLTVREPPRFVSRGGIKLENALERTAIAVEGRRALDVGASTGGFTDCLLQRGAAEVTAVDVGYGELAYRLRTDPRVRVLERTNARALTPAMLLAPPARAGSGRSAGADEEPAISSALTAEAPPSEVSSPQARAASQAGALPDLATIDVSFISLAKVLSAVLGCLAEPYDVLALVKPQFEVGRELLGKGGVVRDPGARRGALLAVGLAARSIDTHFGGPPAVLGFRSSGLPGPKGNRETFIWLAEPTRAGGAQSAEEVERMALQEEP